MERKIGEIFEYQGEWYQCVNTGFSCADCDIKGDCSDEHIGACTGSLRTDGKKVRFKKLEKVGAPVKINGALMQKMKTPVAIGCEQCVLNNNGCSIAYEKCFSNELYVMEQNLTYIVHEYMDKDMTYKDFKEAINYWVDDYNKLNKETDKLTLKPFDLEAAKLGKPVCTRDGRKARIICFDAKGDKPIIALVEAKGNKDALIESF